MKLNTTIALFLVALLVVPPALAQEAEDPGFQDTDVEKSAQTGFKFLSLSLDPHASAMAGALTAQDVGSSVGMFYNPATMANMEGTVDVAVMQTQFIADINYNAGSIAFRPASGRFGVFGLSVVAVDYGEFQETIYDPNTTYRDLGTFSPTALAVGLGYARALSDRFAIGGNVKYALQDLGTFAVGTTEGGSLTSKDYSKATAAFDFGVLYKTGFESMNFAMSVRNFSPELRYEQESFELPLTFRIGVSMDMIDLTSMDPNMHSFVLAIDAERPRDFAEQLKIGGEYKLMNILALRAGYVFPTDTEGVNLGVGLQHQLNSGFGFAFNYAYTTYDVFDAVHRIGIQLSL
ncbi:DUF3308 domain-containing protein [Rhodothermaceae bacterium RA]|nr:DUF3308 domain-containing protein [Rhodothermaceae bacterium RA]